MKIRTANLSDIAVLVDMGRQMHAESPRYSRLSYCAEKVETTLITMINSPDAIVLVAEVNEKIQGAALALIDQEWFSHDKVASELVLFVTPDNRGALIAAKLIACMDGWAERKGVPYLQAGASTGVQPERTAGLYEHMGFQRYGIGFERIYH